MRLHHPIYLEDQWGRFLLLNGNVEIHDGSYYYTGTWEGNVVLHQHITGVELGTTITLQTTAQEFEAVHALINTLIEGMGTSPDLNSSLIHMAKTVAYRLQVRHTHRGASISKHQNIDAKNPPTEIILPYNKAGLETATHLLRVIK